MGDLVEIKSKKQTCSTVRKRVDELLEMLDGEAISNLVVVATTEDGSVISGYANDGYVFSMIGGLEEVKHRLIEDHVEKE